MAEFSEQGAKRKDKDKDFEVLVSLTMEDCNNIVDKLEALKFLNYSIFAEVWREMRFSMIFWRPTWEEVVEFADLLFFVVKNMVLPPNSMSRRLCSMYLLYGVYMKQPGQDYCKFKVTHEEWLQLTELVQFCATEDLKEHVFIFSKLIQLEAFDFCACPIDLVSEKHIELANSKNFDIKLPENLDLEDDKELDELMDSPLFQELMDAEKAYNDNKVIEFEGELEPTHELATHLRKICISKSSKDFDDLRQRQKAVSLATLGDSTSTSPTSKSSKSPKSTSKKSPGSVYSSCSSVPTGGASAMVQMKIASPKIKKPKGYAISSKTKTPAELKLLLPLEGYENIHSKNNRTLFKKTVPVMDKKPEPKKKKKLSGGSTVSMEGGPTPSQGSGATVSETVSSAPSMPLL